MTTLAEFLSKTPIAPYVRESDFAVRTPWRMPIRRLLDYLIIYTQEGTLDAVVEGETYTCEAGDVCLIQPNQLHELFGRTNTITPYAHLDFFYHPLREQSFPTGKGQTEIKHLQHLMQPIINDFEDVKIPIRFRPNDSVRFRDNMMQLVKLYQEQDPISRLEVQALATELIAMILKQFKDVGVSRRRHMPLELNWVTSFLTFRLSGPISVQDMAKRANLSVSRFSALFKQHFGMPPHRYLLQLRLQHASELLVTTALSMDRVAAYCGFANVHHFTKSFKNAYGLPPGKYREQNAGKPAKQPKQA